MAGSESLGGWGIVLAASSVTASVIVNSVLGSYEDSNGHAYGTAANHAGVSVASISAALVAPKEHVADPIVDGVTHGTVATKTFTITNDSNIADAYQISALTVTVGSIASVAFTPSGAAPIPVTVGSTISPVIPAGGSISVAVSVSTTGVRIDSGIEITLTAKTTARSQNGPQSDSGTAWIWVARGPVIVGLGGASASPATAGAPTGPPVAEFVNGFAVATAEPGGALAFSIPFTNIGDVPALGLTVSAQVPAQLTAVAGSPQLLISTGRGGKPIVLSAANVTLSGTTIRASIPALSPGVDVDVVFKATVNASAAIGATVANSADISAQAISDVSTMPAMLLIGAMNTVFDPLAGTARPVAGAVVSLIDTRRGDAVKLSGSGGAPNQTNANPFSTVSNGTFSFGLGSAPAHETDYELDLAAPQYLHRRIKVTLVATADGLPTTTLRALDGMPLAVAGGFKLTPNPVMVSGISGFFGNVPLFAPQLLTVSITADRSVAAPGDRLHYSVGYGPGSKPVDLPGELSVRLPGGVAYARNSARLGAIPSEPSGNRVLTFAVKDLRTPRVLTFDGVVLPAAVSGSTLSTQAGLRVLLSGVPIGSDAGCEVAVAAGPLGSRTIISGRVFTDGSGDGRFVAGDAGVPAVRIFLEDGESVLTDLDGRFSFPAARPGMHVLHLDPITLPPGMRLYRGFPVTDSRSAMRLVHGIFDSGLMEDVNFAVTAAAVHSR